MSALLKNNWYRMKANIGRVIIMFVLILVAVLAAVYLSGKEEAPSTIAVVGTEDFESSQLLKVDHLAEKPTMTQLVRGDYDAIVEKHGNAVTITSIKNDEYQKLLKTALINPEAVTSLQTGSTKIGSKIIGFLLMFLLMSAVTNMYIFSEDKDKKILERIAATPVSFTKLLLSYSTQTFLLIYVPTLLIILILHFLFGIDIGLSPGHYIWLLDVISLFGTGFSLFMSAILEDGDQANMLGSMLMMITTLLSGSFFSLEGGNALIDNIIQFLPQKSYLNMINRVETGADFSSLLPALIYLLGITALFFTIGVLKTRKDYIRR